MNAPTAALIAGVILLTIFTAGAGIALFIAVAILVQWGDK